MIFLANRSNLDRRTLLSRIHDRLQTRVPTDGSAVQQVRYQTSRGNKAGVRATLVPATFLGRSYPTEEAELHVSFDFPQSYSFDFYRIQWIEPNRDLMLGWHQDETHPDLSKCHFQIDYRGETVQRAEAEHLDSHPLNVFDRRTDDLVTVLDALSWDEEIPTVPSESIG